VIPSPVVEAAERELRGVIERRSGGDIAKCLADYGEIARKQIESVGLDDPARRQTCERVLSVLDWARLMLLTRRSALSEDLRVLQKAQSFLGALVGSSG
jgi:hypothetical protein